jgi:hypothetical protein
VTTNDQPINRIVERWISECLPPSFKPFVDRALAGKILAEWKYARLKELQALCNVDYGMDLVACTHQAAH